MLGSKTWHDRILNKVNADIYEPKVETVTNGNAINENIKQEIIDNVNENSAVLETNISQPMEIVIVKQEKPDDESVKTLEEQAAAEILQDLKQEQETTKEISAVPLPADDSLVGKQEVSLFFQL